MTRRSSQTLFYVIVGLAVIGLASFLFRDPGKLFNVLITTLLVGLVIFFIFNAVLKRRMYGHQADEMKKYRRAVKQSKKKYQQNYANTHVFQQALRTAPIRKARRRPTHLRVIEGKKGMKKNDNDRASN